MKDHTTKRLVHSETKECLGGVRHASDSSYTGVSMLSQLERIRDSPSKISVSG